jgi:hypothetical protein
MEENRFMADTPIPDSVERETTAARRVKPDGDLPPPMPLWVKISGIIVIVLVAVFLTIHLSGAIPMNHMPR